MENISFHQREKLTKEYLEKEEKASETSKSEKI
jgi:hypothetical protein